MRVGSALVMAFAHAGFGYHFWELHWFCGVRGEEPVRDKNVLVVKISMN